ncbi:lipase [Dialister sp. CAG:588]|nr:lipase [Dialister sp. CAG:588]
MIDYYDGAFPGLVLSEKEFKDLPTALQEAADKKCKYIVTHTLKVVANKNKEQEYILTLGESIYDKHGKLISYQENVTNTKMMTPIEASLYLLILENKYIDTIF